MENNEENVEKNVSEEKTTSTGASSVVSKIMENKKIIAIVAIVAVVIALFFTIFTRSAKDAGKEYVKAFYNAKASKLYDLIDMNGSDAFDKLQKNKYNEITKKYDYNFEKFDEYYKEVEKAYKELDKDKKKEIENSRKEAIKQTQEYLNQMKDYLKDNKVKWSVKKVETTKIKDSKKLTKVEVTVELKKDGEKNEQTYTIYTMKKGLKNYVVHADLF